MTTYIEIDGWKSNIRFSSAHIIPEYKKCGRLHGHTYAVHIKVSGKPDDKGIILDFSILKNNLKEITSELDHKVLIPEKSKAIKIVKDKKSVKINSLGNEYNFPLGDCIFLPIDSTSAENLANYILNIFLEQISLPKNIDGIEIGVDEGYGQGARISKIFKK
ncbi:MAG: 6-pyruvoyl tetrahydropterin synthase [Thermoplasmatales archaeon SG8-52-3]|nr:MAG: 6-pyruvoyl tetrahydropterin synthase [Thermoplasmatales archaeon SG8-52-3]